MTNLLTADESLRRAHQATFGLFIQTDPLKQGTQETMEQTNQSSPNARRESRAEQTLRHLTMPPTFKEVAIHEAKKAAVWAPILASTLFGTLWASKRLIFKAVTRV